jgi:HTH-type transcriptional regulator, transcriptional repressor of NAD biosynthesis genes
MVESLHDQPPRVSADRAFGTGIVFGKFYPFHQGHQLLIDTAIARCGRVVVLVSFRAGETIPQHVRHAWIAELYPSVNVVSLPHTLPYAPEECESTEQFYEIWRAVCVSACGGRLPDAAFTSEPSYDPFVTRHLKCAHVVVDSARSAVPVSGSAVRADPFANWRFMHPIVRAHFVKTVCVYGPESCGKTTLCERLAAHFETVWQPEFARDHLGERHCEHSDMEPIAAGHLLERRRYKRLANKLLFVDTDTITTKIFSEHYYGRCPPRIDEMIDLPENRNDLYLLLKPDVPWVPDTSRDLGDPQVRWKLYERYEQELARRKISYVAIGGDWDARFEQSVDVVRRMILNRPPSQQHSH